MPRDQQPLQHPLSTQSEEHRSPAAPQEDKQHTSPLSSDQLGSLTLQQLPQSQQQSEVAHAQLPAVAPLQQQHAISLSDREALAEEQPSNLQNFDQQLAEILCTEVQHLEEQLTTLDQQTDVKEAEAASHHAIASHSGSLLSKQLDGVSGASLAQDKSSAPPESVHEQHSMQDQNSEQLGFLPVSAAVGPHELRWNDTHRPAEITLDEQPKSMQGLKQQDPSQQPSDVMQGLEDSDSPVPCEIAQQHHSVTGLVIPDASIPCTQQPAGMLPGVTPSDSSVPPDVVAKHQDDISSAGFPAGSLPDELTAQLQHGMSSPDGSGIGSLMPPADGIAMPAACDLPPAANASGLGLSRHLDIIQHSSDNQCPTAPDLQRLRQADARLLISSLNGPRPVSPPDIAQHRQALSSSAGPAHPQSSQSGLQQAHQQLQVPFMTGPGPSDPQKIAQHIMSMQGMAHSLQQPSGQHMHQQMAVQLAHDEPSDSGLPGPGLMDPGDTDQHGHPHCTVGPSSDVQRITQPDQLMSRQVAMQLAAGMHQMSSSITHLMEQLQGMQQLLTPFLQVHGLSPPAPAVAGVPTSSPAVGLSSPAASLADVAPQDDPATLQALAGYRPPQQLQHSHSGGHPALLAQSNPAADQVVHAAASNGRLGHDDNPWVSSKPKRRRLGTV